MTNNIYGTCSPYEEIGKGKGIVPLKIFVSRMVDFSRYDMDIVMRQLSARGRNKALHIKNKIVMNRSLTAEFLLWHALTGLTGMISNSGLTGTISSFISDMPTGYATKHRNLWGFSDMPDLKEGADGKPYLDSYHDIGFSLSHSGEYVLCAAGYGSVGADIQKIEPLKKDIASRFYTDSERKYIAGSSDPMTAFYHIWVLKESYVKYTGKGLSEGLGSFSVYRPHESDIGRPDEEGVEITANNTILNSKDAFTLDDGHGLGGALKLAVFEMDGYAIGACYKGEIAKKPQMVDIQKIADKMLTP